MPSFFATPPLFFARARDFSLCALVVLLAVRFFSSPGTEDVQDRFYDMHSLATQGLVATYLAGQSPYPPGTFILLAIVTKIAQLAGVSFLFAFKLFLAGCFFLTGLVFLLQTRRVFPAVMLMLALVLNSLALGYHDISFLPTLLLALWALRVGKLYLFALLFTITCLIKPQPLIIAPGVFVYALAMLRTGERGRLDVRRLLATIALPLGLILALLLVFGAGIVQASRHVIGDPYLSGNALNFNWIATYLLHALGIAMGTDSVHPYLVILQGNLARIITKIPFFVMYILVGYRFLHDQKTYSRLLFYSYAAYLAYFLFSTGVHENHLILAVVLAVLLWVEDERYAPVFGVTALVANLNMYLFYGLEGEQRGILAGEHALGVTLFLAGLNITLFLLLLYHSPLGRYEKQPRTRHSPHSSL